MAHNQYSALVVHEEVLEPDYALQIEVVRRLVEEHDVRLAEERLREQDLDLEPAVKIAHQGVVELRVHAEAI